MNSLPFSEQILFPESCARAIRANLDVDERGIVPIGFDTEFDSSVPFTAPKLVLVQMSRLFVLSFLPSNIFRATRRARTG